MKVPKGWVVKVKPYKPYRHAPLITRWEYRVNRVEAETPCWFGLPFLTKDAAIKAAIAGIPEIEAEEPEADWEIVK